MVPARRPAGAGTKVKACGTDEDQWRGCCFESGLLGGRSAPQQAGFSCLPGPRLAPTPLALWLHRDESRALKSRSTGVVLLSAPQEVVEHVPGQRVLQRPEVA